MHRLYLDTNIVIDFLGNRQPFEPAATELMNHVEAGRVLAFTSTINLVHAHYQLRRVMDESRVRVLLNRLMRMTEVVDVPSNVAFDALVSPMTDFEDAIQWAICQHHRIDFLITRNQTDFPAASQPAICDAGTYLNTYQTQA